MPKDGDERDRYQLVAFGCLRHQQLQNNDQNGKVEIYLTDIPFVGAHIVTACIHRKIQRINQIYRAQQQRGDQQQVQNTIGGSHHAVFHFEHAPQVLPEQIDQHQTYHKEQHIDDPVEEPQRRDALHEPCGFIQKQRRRIDRQQRDEHARMVVAVFVVEHAAEREHDADSQTKNVGADAEHPNILHTACSSDEQQDDACREQRTRKPEAGGDHPAQIKTLDFLR